MTSEARKKLEEMMSQTMLRKEVIQVVEAAWDLAVKTERSEMLPKSEVDGIVAEAVESAVEAMRVEFCRKEAVHVAEAVKTERERIEAELADGKFLSDILYPPTEGTKNES